MCVWWWWGEQVDEYLSTCDISEQAPALLLEWQQENLSFFVALGNEEQAAVGVEVPDWFSRNVGEITVESVVNDVMAQLEECSGGRWGAVCLAPNTSVQIMRVASRLAEIAWHPFIQHCMRGVPDNEVVLAIATLGERITASAAVPLDASYYGVHQFYK